MISFVDWDLSKKNIYQIFFIAVSYIQTEIPA